MALECRIYTAFQSLRAIDRAQSTSIGLYRLTDGTCIVAFVRLYCTTGISWKPLAVALCISVYLTSKQQLLNYKPCQPLANCTVRSSIIALPLCGCLQVSSPTWSSVCSAWGALRLWRGGTDVGVSDNGEASWFPVANSYHCPDISKPSLHNHKPFGHYQRYLWGYMNAVHKARSVGPSVLFSW